MTGDAVNTAARLQSAAGAGQTLVSSATHQLTEREFAFEAAGMLALKGKAEPLQVYRLLDVHDARPTDLRGLAAQGLEARLVGRDAELAQVLSAALRVADGRAQVVSLVAQAGVGKSRLVDAVLERLRGAAGFEQATVRRVVSSSVGPRPYGLTAGLFVEGYGIGPADSLESARAKVEHGMRAIGAGDAEIELVVPVVGYILGLQSVERSSEIEPERLKRQIAMTLRTVLERRLAKGPLVLVLEDLQWADAASIEAIPTLADWLCERPLLVVLTGRPPFDPAALDCGRVTHSVLRLEPLADSAIESLLAAFFGAGAESPFEHALAGADRSPGRRQSAVSRGSGPRPHLERDPDPRCRRSLALRCGGRQRRSAVVDRGPAALAHGPPAARGSTHAAERGDPGAAVRVGAARRGGRSRRRSGAARAAVRCRTARAHGRWRRRLRRIRRRAIASPAPWRTTSRTRTCCCGVAPSCISAPARCSKACTEPSRRASRTWRRSAITSATAKTVSAVPATW